MDTAKPLRAPVVYPETDHRGEHERQFQIAVLLVPLVAAWLALRGVVARGGSWSSTPAPRTEAASPYDGRSSAGFGGAGWCASSRATETGSSQRPLDAGSASSSFAIVSTESSRGAECPLHASLPPSPRPTHRRHTPPTNPGHSMRHRIGPFAAPSTHWDSEQAPSDPIDGISPTIGSRHGRDDVRSVDNRPAVAVGS